MWRQQFSSIPEPEKPTYIVGDIHGRFDLLFRMMARIDADVRANAYADHVIVFVGDYVDRGPQSDRVLSLVRTLKEEESRHVVTLKGNHEEMLLKFLATPTENRSWLAHGGFETLASYGITTTTENAPNLQLVEAANELGERMGSQTVAFLEDLDLSFQTGNLFVCHAGADPSREVESQKPKTLIWGSSKFKARPRRDGIWVAHGHFAEAAPSAENGRISTDTGAYFSNVLTAARVTNGDIAFISAEV